MKHSRGKDILKSLLTFGVLGGLLFGSLHFLLRWQITPAYVRYRIPDSIRSDLSYDALTDMINRMIGEIETVAWSVFGAIMAFALIWLIFSWSVRVYKSSMARGTFADVFHYVACRAVDRIARCLRRLHVVLCTNRTQRRAYRRRKDNAHCGNDGFRLLQFHGCHRVRGPTSDASLDSGWHVAWACDR